MNGLNDTNRADLNRSEFYQTHLNRVSRSFAFCIARLDGRMRERVGLSYLLCRLLDTVEDTQWATRDEQAKAFSEFDRFLVALPTSAEVDEWKSRFPINLPEGERRLLADAHRIFADLHAWPGDLRLEITPLILSMSAGMKYFMERKDKQGRLELTNLEQVNKYCFFVAGLVGEILVQIASREFSSPSLNLIDAYRFGLFLQKVNLLKDQPEDEREGRFLVPSVLEVRSSLDLDAKAAFRFLVGIPVSQTGFRLFCAWSLYLGLATLAWIENASDDASSRRLPRTETAKLLVSVEKAIHDNERLERLFEKMAALAFKNSSYAPMASVEAGENRSFNEGELYSLYRGRLAKSEVVGIFRGIV